MKHTLIKNATIVNERQIFCGDVLVSGERIEKIAAFITHQPSWHIIDARGDYLIPGAIDTHVHFREPGMAQKGSIETESKAAIAGGITSFMDMPNTFPNATRHDLLEEKYAIAARSAYANYSFYMGVNLSNLEEALRIDNANICGLTDDGLYFSDKNSMLCNHPQFLEKLFSSSNSLIALHCEDETIIAQNEEIYKALYNERILPGHHALIRSAEACLAATHRVVALAEKHNARLHVLHVSTAAEAGLFKSAAPAGNKRITAECCIHHLYFSDQDYLEKGMHIKWNPSVKTEADRKELLTAIKERRIDNIATDHAPHLLGEKSGHYFSCNSGAPSVQQKLPALFELHARGEISLEDIVEKTSHHPTELFRIIDRGYIREGYFADLVIVDPLKKRLVEKSNLLYKCGWSPFENDILRGEVILTMVNGDTIFTNRMFTGMHNAKRLKFNKNRS